MSNVFIDIETIPEQPEAEAKTRIAETIKAPATMSKPETIAQWHAGEGKYAGVKEAAIEKAYRDTSFDGSKGQICSIAWAVKDGGIQSIYQDGSLTEADVLRGFFQELKSELDGTEPYFIGHYLAGFDLKFIFHRCVVLGVKPEFSLPFAGRHKSDFYCTMQAWAGFKESISQDNLCKALGIEGKPQGIDGSNVWDHFKDCDIQAISDYNMDDVDKVRQIYKRLNFL